MTDTVSLYPAGREMKLTGRNVLALAPTAKFALCLEWDRLAFRIVRSDQYADC